MAFDFPSILGAIAAIGGIGVVGKFMFEVFKSIASKWLDRRFEEKMKKLDHDHDKKTRHMQAEINREFDRAKKLFTKEFDVLSEGWAALHQAYWSAREAVAISGEVHDFRQMTGPQATAFIDGCELKEWQKAALRGLNTPEEKQEYYEPAFRKWRYAGCANARQALRMYVDRNGIFMVPEVRTLFDQLHEFILTALIEERMRITAPDYQDRMRAIALASAEQSHYQPLEALIQKRIWSAAPVEAAAPTL